MFVVVDESATGRQGSILDVGRPRRSFGPGEISKDIHLTENNGRDV